MSQQRAMEEQSDADSTPMQRAIKAEFNKKSPEEKARIIAGLSEMANTLKAVEAQQNAEKEKQAEVVAVKKKSRSKKKSSHSSSRSATRSKKKHSKKSKRSASSQ